MSAKKPSLTPAQLAANDPAYWVHLNKLVLPNGPFTFKNHEYLIEPLSSNHQVEVEMKAAQGGFSIKETLVDLHGCIVGKFPQGVGYTMPTVDDVRKFSRTKFDPLIQQNPDSIGQYVKAGGRGTDTADLKKVGNSFIHFVGTTLSRSIDGIKESSSLRSFSCDKIVCDELDMMDQAVVGKLRGRFGHSEIQQERYISNPTGENYGIHKMFKKSDQRYWHRLCPSCERYTAPELEFLDKPERVIKRDKDGKGYIACKYCGAKLPLYCKKNDGVKSQWIALHPDRDVCGRQWGHLNSVFHDPYVLLQDYYDPPEGNFSDVMRYRLGFPHTSKEDQLRPSQVFECCSQEPMAQFSPGPCAMGVDVGIKKHIIIGVKTGKDRFEILKACTVMTWEEIHDLAKKFHVRSAGIDCRPDIDKAKEFQKAEPYRIWLCDYNVSRHISVYNYDNTNMIIKANRTEILDATHRLVASKSIVFPRQELMGDVAEQLSDPFKQEFKNAKTGISEYRYVGSNDHYRHALNYFYLAARTGQVAKFTDPYDRQPEEIDADNDYARCG
jgi:hypothetical protein